MKQPPTSPQGFADLIAANQAFAARFTLGGFDGVAHRGVAVVTCMDSRIDPLRMLGLSPGDAKIFRNPGGRVTSNALEALVLGVHLLGVERILIVPHTRCAMATHTEQELREKVGESAGQELRPEISIAMQNEMFQEAGVVVGAFGTDLVTLYQLRPGTDLVVLCFDNQTELDLIDGTLAFAALCS
ncbi:MAG: carbonic anhydrase, partial [Pedococcus sp.]